MPTSKDTRAKREKIDNIGNGMMDGGGRNDVSRHGQRDFEKPPMGRPHYIGDLQERHKRGMNLEKFLSESKSEILKHWFDTILDTYPTETSSYLRKQKNRFANPVGSTIFQGIEQVFEEILGEVNPERVSPFLDNIVRVRAVQDFTASQAVSFIFDLKRIIREYIEKNMKDSFPWEEMSVIDARIDKLAILSFDIFMSCREKLYDIKAKELRNMTFRLIERANRLDEAQEDKPEPREDQH